MLPSAVIRYALLGAMFLAWTATAAALPPAPDSEQVRVLVQQLDDPRFPVRRDAEQSLRKFGISVVPLLREHLRARPPLEVTRRLENIVNEFGQLKWRTDRAEALAEAATTHRPLLVFAAMGRPGTVGSRAARAMEALTFADLDVVDDLNHQFVLLWENSLDLDEYAELHEAMAHKPVPYYTDAEVSGYAEGKGAQSIRTYFCTPDGRVVHHLAGFWKAARYRSEARFARELIGEFTGGLEEQQIETVRRRLRERGEQFPESAANYELAVGLVSEPVTTVLDALSQSCNLTH